MAQTSQSDVCVSDFPSGVVGRYSELHEAVFATPLKKDFTLPHSSLAALKAAATEPICSIGANWSKKEVSKAASLFLFRKCLPSQAPDVQGYLRKLARPEDPNIRFVTMAKEVIPQLFRQGWDKRWRNYVMGASLTDGACKERSRKAGGTRSYIRSAYPGVVRDKETGQTVSEFQDRLLRGDLPKLDPVREVVEVDENGKVRLVTIASGDQAFLSPLHHLIYDHLVEHGGVLRGDPTVRSMDTLVRESATKDEVFVSGDYESATDNFEVAHSRILLRLIQKQSLYIPGCVFDMAASSLTGSVVYKERVYPQTNAQLMGNYLSFPLLCLTNLLTLFLGLGSLRAKELLKAGLVKINGDDIVFRCRVHEVDAWKTAVAFCGLKLSEGKTLVHKRFWSLNSTFFRAGIGKLALVPVIRSKSIIVTGNVRKRFWTLNDIIADGLKGFHGDARARGTAWILRRYSGVLGVKSGSRGVWTSVTDHFEPQVVYGTLRKTDHGQMVRREAEIRHPVWCQQDTVFGDLDRQLDWRDKSDVVPSATRFYGIRPVRTRTVPPGFERAAGNLVGKCFRDWVWAPPKGVDVAQRVDGVLSYFRVDYRSNIVTYDDLSEDDLRRERWAWRAEYRDSGTHVSYATEPKSVGNLAEAYEQLYRQRASSYPKNAEEFASLGSASRAGIGSKAAKGGLLAPGWLAEGVEKVRKEPRFRRSEQPLVREL